MKHNKIKPNKTQLKNMLQKGFVLHQQNKLQEAKVIYEQILVIEPNDFNALHFLGLLYAQTNQFIKAVNFLTQALQIKPNNVDCCTNYGNVLQELKHFDEAIEYYDKALQVKKDALTFYNRGSALKELKRFDESLASYEQAININPDADIYNNLGYVLQKLNRLEEALVSYVQAIGIKPDHVEAYFNSGSVLQELKRFDESLASYEQAISIKPDYEAAYNNLGNVLKELKRFDESLASYEQAISIKPNYAEAYFNRGVVLQELSRFDESLASYEHAINIKPNYAEAYFNCGNALLELKRYNEVIACYEQATSIKPDYKFVIGLLQHVKMLACNWGNFNNQKDLILKKIDTNEIAVTPFVLVGLADSPSTHRRCSEMYIKEKYPLNNVLGAIPKKIKKNKIRLGYYSADFHNHATAYLMINFFELHDKNQFEIYAFSFGFSEEGEMRSRIKNAFDEFIEVSHLSDESAAKLSRDLEIDIAIDLKGFTKDSRTGIFSCRAAPLQVNYLGYPGTMRANYIDYIVGDKTLIPIKSQEFYSEKVIYLPNSYQVNDRKKIISDKQFSRAELELPQDSFVFCCFNNNYKILPSTFDSWMRILKAVQGSILWLLQDNEFAYENLKKEAQERGVDASRLVFAKRLPLEEHLARHRQADLFLDTSPYNAHTTASDALWAGLPVLTMTGESFASRVAASLLTAIGLLELITSSQEHYEALAIELATNPTKLKVIKAKLERNRLTTPLFDTPRFTKHLEEAYTKIYERYHADLPPEHIYIEEEQS